MKTWKEILWGIAKVVIMAGVSAAVVVLIAQLETLSVEQGTTLAVIINVVIYFLKQIAEQFLPAKK